MDHGVARRASDTSTDKDSSLSSMVSTLVPVLILAVVYLLIFCFLRRKYNRNYAPRTFLGNVPSYARSPPLPTGFFNWIPAFCKVPDTQALMADNFDGYLFLRYMKMLVLIAFVGSCISWPILFPINITGHGGNQELNVLVWGNVRVMNASGRNRLYAHVGVAWLFYGFILLLITRESIFYINLRQAFLLAPSCSKRVSSRTVLFTAVPEPYLNEAKLRAVFGEHVRHIWITYDTEKIDDLVKERDKVVMKLENAEIKLIKLVNAERAKAIKAGAAPGQESNIESAGESPSSVSSRWVQDKKRPRHRTGKFGLIGPKVDTIEWYRKELQRLIPETDAAQLEYLDGKVEKKVPAVFIEFDTQSQAQAALQTLAHHQALHMSPRHIGVQPWEVVWSSLKISWWQKVIRRFAAQGFITALIIFWAIPVAFVGFLSNISALEQKYSWLHWLGNIPSTIFGVISGLLPSVLLAVLMSLVPVIMRLCAKLSGEPTLARVELFTQNAYFAFQVIQVFLVGTVASSATALLSSIEADPGSTPSLLSKNIPKASNLYISYFIVQGLAVSSKSISNVVGTVIFWVMYKLLRKTPRAMYKQWISLSGPMWGSILPVYTNIAVIAIIYAVIAPLVLGFATIGLFLFYISWRYNILYVSSSSVDTKGLIYPRALQQLFVGLYIAELCIIGLSGTAKAWGPLALMVIFLVFTILYQISLNRALEPLLYNLPRTLEIEEEAWNMDGDIEAANRPTKGPSTTTPPEKASHIVNKTDSATPTQQSHSTTKRPNLLTKFLKPHIYSDYQSLRQLVPKRDPSIFQLYDGDDVYYPPSVNAQVDLIWLPRDPAGVSRQEVQEISKITPATDEGAELDEKGKVVWDTEGRPPVFEEKGVY